MRTRVIAVVVSCVAIAAAAVAQTAPQPAPAQAPAKDPSRPVHPPTKWWANPKYKHELKLQDWQSTEIDKIFNASMDRLRVDKDDFDRAQTNFADLMTKPTVAEREFQRAVDQLELARFNLNKERTLMLVRIHNVLTADQRKGLDVIRNRDKDVAPPPATSSTSPAGAGRNGQR